LSETSSSSAARSTSAPPTLALPSTGEPSRAPSSSARPSGALPIGVFDSGLGGLTVARAIHALLPDESILFLGDTARIPYGTRSPETIRRYARLCAQRLQGFGIKCLVVACNTVSAVALPSLARELDVPVIGVVEAGARASLELTRNRRIGVLATYGTIESGVYPDTLRRLAPDVHVESRAAAVLVALVEEGWIDGPIARQSCERYLRPLIASRIDTLLLGCTHFPLLAPLLGEVAAALAGHPIAVTDTPQATALELELLLARLDLLVGADAASGELSILVTDRPAHFEAAAHRFLGEAWGPTKVQAIDL